MDRARIAIATMIGLGIVLAGYAWWFRKGLGDDALHFWGHDAAVLIRNSPRVTLLHLEPAAVTSAESSEFELLRFEQSVYAVTQAVCISNAPGVLNLRQALIEDASFVWEGQQSEEPVWAFGLRFESQTASCTVLVDRLCRQVCLAGRSSFLSVWPISQGLREFVSEHTADSQ